MGPKCLQINVPVSVETKLKCCGRYLYLTRQKNISEKKYYFYG